MLKMCLDEISKRIQLNPKIWFHINTTNCYAYALGLDINERNICKDAYQPGTISETSNVTEGEYFLYDDLINGIEGDLKALNISYREIDPQDSLDDDEWKIALLIKKYDERLSDFHFLREKKNGIWFHKYGYQDFPTKKDSLRKKITNPTTECFPSYTYDKCYALRINKKDSVI